MQKAYDPLDWHDAGLANTIEEAEKLALAQRNTDLRSAKKQGARGFRLTGQLRPYAGLGIPDGRVRTVYYIDYPFGFDGGRRYIPADKVRDPTCALCETGEEPGHEH